MNMNNKSIFAQRSERGSLLVVAMIFSSIIGIMLVSYIQLARTAQTLSNRAVYNNGAVNLAERGLEEAMYSVNQSIANPSYLWSGDGWTESGSNAYRKWTETAQSQNTTTVNRVYVYNFAGISAPKIVSRATVTLGGVNSRPVEKWIEVTLAKTSKFSNGLVAKNSIVFNGNGITIDSWNSDPNGDGSVIHPYSSAYRNDNGTAGSISVSTSAVNVGQGDVWGYVATGGADPTNSVGNNGSVLGSDSVNDGTWTKSTVDPDRISTQFSATFDAVTVPTTYKNSTTPAVYTPISTITGTVTLPRPGDTAGPDGYYYYSTPKIDVGSHESLTITGKVLLKLTDTSSSIRMTAGDSVISIGLNGMLEAYGAGDVSLSGQGIANGVDSADAGTDISDAEAGRPQQFQFYGTKTSGTQSIDLTGGSAFRGTIYAPQGNVKVAGGAVTSGSIVANDITLNGGATFHYDESLAALGGNSPFRVSKWKELTSAADRAAYSTVLNF
jgi:Tfp pilus assembly protein PilX